MRKSISTVKCTALFICLLMALTVVTETAAADYVYAKGKKANTLKVTGKTVRVKQADIRKKSRTIARKKVLTVKKAKGKVTYKIAKVTPAKYKKYFRINKKTGKVTVKKGLGKGTYRIKAAVTAAGSRRYKKRTRKATFKVIIEEEKHTYEHLTNVDIFCAQTARDFYSDSDLEFIIDLVRNRLEPQAVEMLLDRFPCMRAAADQGLIGRELGLYLYYKAGDKDGVREHENAGPSGVQLMGMAAEEGGSMVFKYVLAVDLSLLSSETRDPDTGFMVMEHEGEKLESVKDRIAGEMLRAMMFDYNRIGMMGVTDMKDAVGESGKFASWEQEQLYSKFVFPKWFTEGTAAAVGDVFRTEREQFKVLRNEENKDLLSNYVSNAELFDLENNVLEYTSEGSCRASGYLAVLYLADLMAIRATGKSSIDESGAVSAEKLCEGLNAILERLHNGETLDQIIYDISPVSDSPDHIKLYTSTEEFENYFVKGKKDGDEQYAGNAHSIDFVNVLLDFLERKEKASEGELSGGSILTDLEESYSPLDDSKDSESEYLRIVESNMLLGSTVPDSVALNGGGRSGSGADQE